MRRYARRYDQCNCSTGFTREEVVGFCWVEVDYQISGTLSAGSPGSYDEPPDPGEIEVIDVYRVDPLTKKEKRLESKDWPFTDREYDQINQALSDNAEPDEPDDWDPPDREPLDDGHVVVWRKKVTG